VRLSVRRSWLGLFGLILLIFRAGSSLAASPDPWAPFDAPWFDRVSTAEGLPPSIVTALAQDRQGLLWIGTMVGLARYDGYRTQMFDVRGGNGKGLPDAYVRCLLALPDGGLLVGTNAGGLVRFDPATNTFRSYPNGADGTSDSKIFALADDHAGGVWIATEQGLDHLDLRSNTIRHVDTGSEAAPCPVQDCQEGEGRGSAGEKGRKSSGEGEKGRSQEGCSEACRETLGREEINGPSEERQEARRQQKTLAWQSPADKRAG